MTVEYVGVWDTVGALGVPASLIFANFFNKRYQFHDLQLSPMDKSARHVLAIDERRRTFAPTQWINMDELNKGAVKTDPNPVAPPYLQQWFPGDHASVGGGGDVNGLWEAALVWVVEGAQLRGLAVNEYQLEQYRTNVDPKVSVYCMKNRTFSLSSLSTRRWRDGPKEHDLSQVSDVARRRFREPAPNLAEQRPYRPKTLKAVTKKLIEQLQ